jgi:hypothetical protein
MNDRFKDSTEIFFLKQRLICRVAAAPGAAHYVIKKRIAKNVKMKQILRFRWIAKIIDFWS